MSKRPIVHFEIPARDRITAARFYKELAGWEYRDRPEMTYTSIETGNVAGGYYQRTPEQPSVLSFYIESDDIDADLKKVESLGGKVALPRTEVPGVGWIGFFIDLDGNVVGWRNFFCRSRIEVEARHPSAEPV